jgi:competence protein ComEC
VRLPDGWVVVLAGATALGAYGGVHVGGAPVLPLGLALGVVAAALVARRPALLGLALAVLAAVLAQRSLAGLEPLPRQEVRTEVTLVSDPVPLPRGGVRVDVRLHGKRVAATAWSAAGAALQDRLAGERVLVVGDVGPPGPYERRMPHRHLAGRLQVDTVAGWRPGHRVTQWANSLRRTLEAGASSLSDRQQALLAGLVVGDDRRQPEDLTDAFRAAGLSHVTAVSGQNVMFVVAVASPLLRRVRFGSRLLLTLALLGGFAVVTRGEPSVQRATVVAAVGALGSTTGRPLTSLRTLGWAVTTLLLVDPLLVTSLGFQLSVLGALGIVVGSGPLARRLPGPRWLTMPVAVTLAAQGAVAPLLIVTFGPVDLGSLPANLLAVPAAGAAMVWGLTAGLVAGVLGEPAASLLHLPTRVLLWWIESVARTTAQAPHLRLDLRGLALVVLVVAASLQRLGRCRHAPARTDEPVTPSR